MHKKGVITLSELVFISIAWGVCITTWKSIIIDGLGAAATVRFPAMMPYYRDVIVGAVLVAVLFAIIILSRNIDIGNQKVFELNNV